jgi:4-hydroxybenzoate polyprenyltransferase
MPGIFAYYLASGLIPPVILMLGGFFHISAMHIFSAIPDREYDKNASINTTPVLIGEKYSLVLCFIFWMVLSFIVIYLTNFYPLSFLVFLYPLFPLILLIRDLEIEKLYWYLPIVNTGLGGLLFTALVIYKLFVI